MNTTSGSNETATVSGVLAKAGLPVSFCDEFRRTGGELMQLAGGDACVVGACAVHAGIQFMVRSFAPNEVASWLEHEAQELRKFAERTRGGEH